MRYIYVIITGIINMYVCMCSSTRTELYTAIITLCWFPATHQLHHDSTRHLRGTQECCPSRTTCYKPIRGHVKLQYDKQSYLNTLCKYYSNIWLFNYDTSAIYKLLEANIAPLAKWIVRLPELWSSSAINRAYYKMGAI